MTIDFSASNAARFAFAIVALLCGRSAHSDVLLMNDPASISSRLNACYFSTTELPISHTDYSYEWNDQEKIYQGHLAISDQCSWQFGSAKISLFKGTVRLMEPLNDDPASGLFFRGSGTISIVVHDQMEMSILKRFFKDIPSNTLDIDFHRMLLRVSDDSISRNHANHQLIEYSRFSQAIELQDNWLSRSRKDVNARILCARGTPGDLYACAAIFNQDHGWLTFEFDSRRDEESRLEKSNDANDCVDVLLSQDDNVDSPIPVLDTIHFDFAIDMTDHRGRKAHDIAQGSEYGRERPFVRLKSTLRLAHQSVF
jgi:hypothetical protein